MMLRFLTTTAVVAVGLLAAPPIFAQTGQPGHAVATSAKDALDQEDKTFVREAAIGGMAEVELSKIAQKSENADVKRFAERMIEDHTKANEQLTSIAAGLGVETPRTVDSEHERMREKLQTLHGKAPVGVAQAAGLRGIPVVAVVGRSTLTEGQLATIGISRVYPLSDLEPDPVRSTAEASALLQRVGQTLAREVMAGGTRGVRSE